jgi:hypothetical protein
MNEYSSFALGWLFITAGEFEAIHKADGTFALQVRLANRIGPGNRYQLTHEETAWLAWRHCYSFLWLFKSLRYFAQCLLN